MSPFQFEIKNENGDLAYVRVLNTFEHYYTTESMRSIRIDSLAAHSVTAVSEHRIVNEDEFKQLLERRVLNDPG